MLKKYESELYKPEKWKNERYEKKKEIHRNIHDGREFKPRSNRPSRGGRLRIEEENPLPPLSLVGVANRIRFRRSCARVAAYRIRRAVALD